MTQHQLSARQVVEQYEENLNILLPKTVDCRAFLAVYEEEIDFIYEKILVIVMIKKNKDVDRDLIKKAARLLKGEQLNDEQRSAYRLHTQRRNNYRRLKIYIDKRNQQWSIDLADLNELSGFNNQYRYLLVCVDIATRYAFVKPCKVKTANNVSIKNSLRNFCTML